MTNHLISDIEKIKQVTERLKLVNRDIHNWTETYIDETTGEKWFYYRVNTYLQGGGYPILARQPLPDTKLLIKLSLFSDSDDEVFAACRTLVDDELNKNLDFRADLIKELEKLNNIDRQKRVIKLIGLDNALNRRDIFGKTFEQINSDAEYYRSVADRAEKLI